MGSPPRGSNFSGLYGRCSQLLLKSSKNFFTKKHKSIKTVLKKCHLYREDRRKLVVVVGTARPFHTAKTVDHLENLHFTPIHSKILGKAICNFDENSDINSREIAVECMNCFAGKK